MASVAQTRCDPRGEARACTVSGRGHPDSPRVLPRASNATIATVYSHILPTPRERV